MKWYTYIVSLFAGSRIPWLDQPPLLAALLFLGVS